jgi:adenylate cyclase
LEPGAFAPILLPNRLDLPEDQPMSSTALHVSAEATPERPAATAAANPLVEWILAEGWDAASLPDLVRGLCRQMLAIGLPLCRMRLHVRTLHPQYLGTSYTWTRGSAEIEEFNATYAILNAECYQASPFKAIFDDGVGGVRRRLDIPGLVLDYPVLEELRAEGATDYVAMPIVFSDARRSALTCAADRPGGFATEELEAIYGMLPVLSRLLEVHALRRTARTILETYLGRVSGERVLQGLVRRGDGEDIDAVIWFSDLRGSTPLADVLPRPVFLELLNGYFEAMAGSVLAHDGEVLRYIGDALLAIFPLGDGNGNGNGGLHPAAPTTACSRALAAAREAIARMDALNEHRAGRGEQALRFGIGLHVGAVMYGNIGVDQRLEFTVIGAAANEAARLEAMCKTLDRPLVLSAELARLVEEPVISLGVHALRGVREPHEVLTLADL